MTCVAAVVPWLLTLVVAVAALGRPMAIVALAAEPEDDAQAGAGGSARS
jgi:hypothetical protein